MSIAKWIPITSIFVQRTIQALKPRMLKKVTSIMWFIEQQLSLGPLYISIFISFYKSLSGVWIPTEWYHGIVTNFFIPELRQYGYLLDTIYMQVIVYSRIADWVQHFHSVRVISRFYLTLWLPRDLNPCDSWFIGFFEDPSIS